MSPSSRTVRESASSKSLALTGSMVTTWMPRRSTRRLISSAGTSSGIASAAAVTSGGNSVGNPLCLTMRSTSRPRSPGVPSTSLTRPVGPAVGEPQSVISTMTFCPSSASIDSMTGTKTSRRNRGSSGLTVTKCFARFTVPTNMVEARSSTFTTFPSGRPRRCVSTRTTTLSP